MKHIFILSLLLTPAAFADESASATPAATGKPEETVTLSQEATEPLFERVRGALNRAVKDGKVVASTSGSAAPAASTAPAK